MSKNKETYRKTAELFSLLSNPKRLEILEIIGTGELGVGDVVKKMGIRKANVSQHLAKLRYLKLVTTRQEGKNVYYRLVFPEIIKSSQMFHKIGRIMV